jgi:CheY-like chemotaxis protein
MTLSLMNVVRRFLYGSRSNGNGGGLPYEEERAVLSAESYRTAKTVLFVDDEPSILKMRRLVFEALGYSVLTAISGEKALEALELHPVDVVVLDYLMPGMDGEETARCIRRLRGDIPIILSTGCLTVPERVLEVVNAAVEKGARPEALIEVLEQQLSLCSTPNSPASVKAEPHGWQALGIIWEK